MYHITSDRDNTGMYKISLLKIIYWSKDAKILIHMYSH